MHVISKKALAVFWQRHREAEKPLRTWYSIAKKTRFENFAHLKKSFGAVDKVKDHTVFDIGGNKWRVIAIVHYATGKIYIRAVLTHDEYSRGLWKRE